MSSSSEHPSDADPEAVEHPGGVGETALGAAMMRAQESVEPDALFTDPHAAAFVAAAPRPFEHIPDPDGRLAELEVAFRADVAIRTRFFDDFLASAVAYGSTQVVLLAAGLDTRAFRLRWPDDIHLFELDLPDVLAFKKTVLRREGAEPRCVRTTVPADLRGDWAGALRRAGLDTGAPTAWTAEGLLAYLAPDDIVRLLEAITALSAQGSELAFEAARTDDDSALARASELPELGEVASMWHDQSAEQPGQWLLEHGWTTTVHRGADLAERYRREPGPTTGRYLTATFAG